VDNPPDSTNGTASVQSRGGGKVTGGDINGNVADDVEG